MKKLLSLLLPLALCLTLCVPAMAYTDVTDETLAHAAAVLSGLGVVSGYEDGTYRPGTTLTRAQFCKLAVLTAGYGDAVTTGGSKTVFSDVAAGSWAAPYVALACEKNLVSGYGNGTFGPNDPVTTAQAVTVALKLLGYTTADVGPFWPEDYIAKARGLGLLDGISKSAEQALTRGDAAILLYNLLAVDTTQGRALYLSLCATAREDVVLLSADATSTDGTRHTVKLYADGAVSYVLPAAEVPSALEGQRGTLLLDKAGKVCGFLPGEGAVKTVTLSAATASALGVEDGTSVAVPSSTAVLLDDERISYQDCWYDLLRGDEITVFFTASGTVDLLWVRSSGGAETTVTGYYEDAVPNTGAPEFVTVLGASLPVTDAGRAALSAFSVGDKITLTLDRSGSVCAASAATGTGGQYGILKSADGERAEVELLSGVTAVGAITTAIPSTLTGGLVQVRASAVGTLSVSALSSSASAVLDVAAGTVGGKALSSRVRIFEQVGGSTLTEIAMDDILTETATATCVGTGADGLVDLLVLNDATGACYRYGILDVAVKTTGNGTQTVANNTVSVVNADGTGTAYITGETVEDGAVGGVAGTASGRAGSVVLLTAAEGLTRADFSGSDSVRGIPIAQDVQVYNKVTQRWTTLSAAKAFSNAFSVYYDATRGESACVRVIFAY